MVHLQLTERRVGACVPEQQADKQTCRAITQNAFATATLILDPVPDERTLQKTDPRLPLRLELQSDAKPQQTVTLEAGEWAVEWQQAGIRKAVLVIPDKSFRISLRTLIGGCVEARGECTLVADLLERNLDIPAEHRSPK